MTATNILWHVFPWHGSCNVSLSILKITASDWDCQQNQLSEISQLLLICHGRIRKGSQETDDLTERHTQKNIQLLKSGFSYNYVDDTGSGGIHDPGRQGVSTLSHFFNGSKSGEILWQSHRKCTNSALSVQGVVTLHNTPMKWSVKKCLGRTWSVNKPLEKV